MKQTPDHSIDSVAAFLETVGPETAFRAMTGLLPDAAVFVVDGERTIIHWSEGAQRLLGFTREEAVGRLCLSSIRCRTCTIGCGVEKLGSLSDIPLEHFRADERWVPTKKYARGFFDDAGKFLGAIEILIPTGAPRLEEGTLDEALLLPPEAEEFQGIVSRDPTMLRAFATIRNVAETGATVLVRGESGSGKELVAQAIHRESHRATGPFIAVNCAALTPGLLESELFGHIRGAFTGAVRDRKGLFEQASGGTLFLDEVAELPLEMQSKLLRVLEERRLTPVGASREIEVDIRVVAATHRALRTEVKAGRFREDLMYRLRVVPLFLPPLRDRRGDVDLLLRFFLRQFNMAGPRHVDTIAPDAMRALLTHDWPGNVRELRNVIEYAFAVGRGEEIRQDELPPEFEEPSGESPSTRDSSRSEGDQIREALEREGGRVGAAAKRLGMSRATFWRKRRKYEIE